MGERIVLRNVARVLSEEELSQVAGGDEGGGEWSSGQPTSKVSSQDPNGPIDQDKSTADW